jgi:hypothetical protein
MILTPNLYLQARYKSRTVYKELQIKLQLDKESETD